MVNISHKRVTKVLPRESRPHFPQQFLCTWWSENIIIISIMSDMQFFSSNTIKLYTSFVRPHLKYASSVWNPFHKSEINNLEKVQRFAMTVCLKKWNLRSEELLTLTRFPTLQLRRLAAVLCHLFKILHNLTSQTIQQLKEI